jgi:hypothetical protein
VPDVRVALAALALGLPAFTRNVWHSTSTSSFPMPELASLAAPLLLALLALAAVGGVLLFPGVRRLRALEEVPRDTRLDAAR